MGANVLAVASHPPILIQTVSKEGALLDFEDPGTRTSLWTFLRPGSPVVPGGHRCRVPPAPALWSDALLSQGFDGPFLILRGSGQA